MISTKPNPLGLHESPNSSPENISTKSMPSITIPEMMAFNRRFITVNRFKFH